ncbi:unnamed protein product [Parajaminaea phylloscopi]
MSGYKVIFFLCMALAFVPSVVAHQGPPAGEGDCITQKVNCVIAYLDDMHAGQQQVSNFFSSWQAGTGLGWSVSSASTGKLKGNCQGEPTEVDYVFSERGVTTEAGYGRGKYDYTNGAVLLLINC